MPGPTRSIADQFHEQLRQFGKGTAQNWLSGKITDAGVLQAAKLWADNPDQPWARAAFEGAWNATFGNLSAQPVSPSQTSVTDLLERILAEQSLPESLQRAQLKDYLHRLRLGMERCNALGLTADPNGPRPPRLEKVYIERSARIPRREDLAAEHGKGSSPENLFEALVHRSRAVITADAGMGKTFLFRHLCLQLTDSDLVPNDGPRFEPSVPILILLRHFGPWLRREKASRPETEKDKPALDFLWDYLEFRWKREFSGLASGLRDWIDTAGAAKRITFLFDGLDEVPIDGGDRVWVSEMIMELGRRYPATRVYVTCRVKSYGIGDRPWGLELSEEEEGEWIGEGEERDPAWPIVQIPPFSSTEVEGFINGWFAELAHNRWFETDHGEALAQDFIKALKHRPELRKLAPSPLMLTQMCLIHGTKGQELPDGRGALYHKLIRLMLSEWEKQRQDDADRSETDRFTTLCRRRSEIFGVSELTTEEFVRKLAELVFTLTSSFSGGSQSDGESEDEEGSGILIPESDLAKLLLDLCLAGRSETDFSDEQRSEARVWREEMLAFIKDHGGLLDQVEGEGSGFAFPHRQYGEFLAGWYLVKHHLEKDAGQLATLCATHEEWRDVWREPVLFGISWLRSDDAPEKIQRYVRHLTGQDPNQTSPVNLTMAGEILAEFGRREQFTGADDVWSPVKNALTTRMLAQQDSVPERIRMGLSVGLMGDDRAGVGTKRIVGIEVPDIRWSETLMPPPEGFLMGADAKDEDAYDFERPQFRCQLISAPFRIAIHPITVLQYLTFVKAGGYRDDLAPRWWTSTGLAWKRVNGIDGPEFLSQAPELHAGNLPATGISFHEAVAFCRWLRDVGKDDGHLAQARLCTEPEWEFAARGANGRRFPWGDSNENLEERCHFDEVGIYYPSPVGLFSDSGRAINSGVEDLAGNVWEWTATEWVKDYGSYRPLNTEDGDRGMTLRGGAFNVSYQGVRASFLDWSHPFFRYSDVGFRVVSSPF